MKLKIQIQGKEVELSPEEARELFNQLNKVYGFSLGPINVFPVLMPVPMPIPYQPAPQWTEPFRPYYDVTCRLVS